MIVDSWLRVHKDEADIEQLKSQFMVRNPDYVEAVRLGRNTVGIPQWMPLWEKDGDYLLLPRGIATRYMNNPNYFLDDRTSLGYEVDFKSKIVLRPNQVSFDEQLREAVLSSYGAIGMAQPGFGER